MLQFGYNAGDDVFLYARAAKGFRLGSVQQFINEAFCAGELASLEVDEIPTTIENDSLWNYEGRIKSTILGATTTLNVAAYRIEWEDARTQVLLSCGWIPEFNDVQIVSDGIEIELASQASENLFLNLGVGYTQSELSAPAPSINGQKGDRTP